ncbi:MAG: hypothetical protein V1875_08255 [Candidatus Altiarchaeota archaeon]
MSVPHEPIEPSTPRIRAQFSQDQLRVVDDWDMMETRLRKERTLNGGDGYGVLCMHSFMKGCGLPTILFERDAKLVPKALKDYGPKVAFTLGEITDPQEVDHAFKRILQVITLWPLDDQGKQYSVTNVEVIKTGKEWMVTANKKDGQNPRRWRMRIDGDLLKVTSQPRQEPEHYKELRVAQNTRAEPTFYEKNQPIKALEVHSLAKQFEIPTNVSEIDKNIWLHELEEYRRGSRKGTVTQRAAAGYKLAKMRYHLSRLGIDSEDVNDEKLIRRSLAHNSKSSNDGLKAAGLLMFMQALGMNVTAAEKTNAEKNVRKALLENREDTADSTPERDGESAAWLRMALHQVYGDEPLYNYLRGVLIVLGWDMFPFTTEPLAKLVVQQQTLPDQNLLPNLMPIGPSQAKANLGEVFQLFSDGSKKKSPAQSNDLASRLVSGIDADQSVLQGFIDGELVQRRDAFLTANSRGLKQLNIQGTTMTSIRRELVGKGLRTTADDSRLLDDCTKFLDDAGIFISALMRQIPDKRVAVDMSRACEEFNFLGSFLDRSKEISITGLVGDNFAAHSKKGKITARGNVGNFAFANLRGAETIVEGNCGRGAGDMAQSGLAKVKGLVGEVGVPGRKFVLLHGPEDNILWPPLGVSDIVRDNLVPELRTPLIYGTANLNVHDDGFDLGLCGLRCFQGKGRGEENIGIRVETTDTNTSEAVAILVIKAEREELFRGLNKTVLEVSHETGSRGNFYEICLTTKPNATRDYQEKVAEFANEVYRLQQPQT